VGDELVSHYVFKMKFPFDFRGDKAFDVVGFGTNAVDFLIQVPEYPAFDSKVELTDYTQAAGGEVATTMAGLSRLGMRTAYVGRFGSDAAGEFGMRSLKDEGVDLSQAEIVDGAKTQIAFIVIDTRSGERTVIWQRDDALSYAAAEAPVNVAASGKVLHLTPHDAAACIEMAREARSHGTMVSTDIDNIFDGMDELLPLVDVLIMSRDIPERLTGISDINEALADLSNKFGCSVVGATLGDSGSTLYCQGEYIDTTGFAVPGGCKDTTGAGDAFRVGLLYGMLKGETVEESARAANAIAALKCRAVGARTALPNAKELEEFRLA
jgi:sugar/nucleoside kinase (ribokinase family)